MERLFSSGEILYKKNQKKLEEGLFIGEKLACPDDITPDTRYVCRGTLNGEDSELHFKVHEEELENIITRHKFGILMQSDILQAKWGEYEIIFGA